MLPIFFVYSAAPPILAFVTTIHLALVVLRAHRSPAAAYSFVTFVSVLFAGSPWLISSLLGLAIGFVVYRMLTRGERGRQTSALGDFAAQI